MATWDWDNDNNGGGEKISYTKFPEGIVKLRIIDDAPHIRWVHWMSKHKRAVECIGSDCPICAIRKAQKETGEPYVYNSTRRLCMNVINRTTGNFEVMEQGATFFTDLKEIMIDLSDEGKTLYDVDIRVKRRGKTKDDTAYRIDVDREYPLSEEDKALMEKRINFATWYQKPTVEQIHRLLSGEEWKDVFVYEKKGKEDDGEEIILQ